uniref:uncharacterized protein LOC122587821 n=1 Tax=Erigeron canadensis TaxID=72917 RepID=UPI001CB91547|nr:uncharacterized protein LOC122587821 [Erigeron canadensis]
MATKPKKNLAIRIITTPYRMMSKAKDFYIKSIINCSNHTTYGRAGVMTGMPRSFSTTSYASTDSAAEDLRELIRANSTSRMGDLNLSRAELELYVKQQLMRARSASVGMGRIDEDAPISDVDGKMKIDGLRSKSYAGTTKTNLNTFSKS